MSPQTSLEHRPQNIALCYVRLSQSHKGEDAVSPERQRANILAKCRELGYTPEWYEDTDGHKSGRDIKNRPGWQALTERLGDPDVVALIGNDLARFHRKGWRVGDLVEFVEENNISLILAAPGRQINTSTPMGKVFIYLTAIFDEFYAEDISYRVKDSIIHRKNLGKTIGRPPFGTIRDEEGYLMPLKDEGAWWLINGRFVAGTADSPPEENAIWHSYYESAQQALTLFAQGNIGMEKLAYQLTQEGYAFRDRKGKPRKFNRDDVRRVVANWPEYGGLVFDEKAKDRPTHTRDEVDNTHLDSDKAVFPIDLLKQVGYVRSERTLTPADHGRKRNVYPYPLSHITRCAHCEKQARQQNDPRLRSSLGGTTRKGVRVYRHKRGVTCDGEIRSIPCEVIEADIGKLIKGLMVKDEVFTLMLELAHQFDEQHQESTQPDMAQTRERNIIKLKKKLENTKMLFREAEISEEDYRTHMAEYRAELAYWEAYTTEKEEVKLQLSLCLEAIGKVAELWEVAEAKERRVMAHNLFDYIVYDLDKQRIVDFRLKAWANRFLVLRAELSREAPHKNENSPASGRRDMPHTGLEPRLRFVQLASKNILNHIFPSVSPHVLRQKALAERNQRIKKQFAQGELVIDLAAQYGISHQRISQIIHQKRR